MRSTANWVRRAAGWAIAGAALLAGTPEAAAANNVTITTSNIRYRNTETNRPGGSQYQSYISYADCLRSYAADDPYTAWYVDIPVTWNSSVGTLQLWAAETDNCATDLSRNNSNGSTGQCQKIDLISSSTGIYKVNARDIVKVLGVGSDCLDGSGQTSARTVTLYFLLAGSAEDTAGTINASNVASLQMKVDLVGPKAPTNLSLNAEDGQLKIILSATGSGTTADADTKGYYVYIDPVPPAKQADWVDGGGGVCTTGTGGAGGSTGSTTSTTTTTTSAAGGGGAGGATGSTTTTTTTTTTSATGGAGGGDADAGSSTQCASGVSIPCVDPTHPSFNASSRYDTEVNAPASSIPLDGLVNGQTYTVAVAAFDAVNNIGPLSVLQCGTPQPTDTFLKVYCSDGGSTCVGGCGSCEVGSVAELGWPSLLASAVAVAGLAARRRRRTQRRDAVDCA